jgi:hypothetical protein
MRWTNFWAQEQRRRSNAGKTEDLGYVESERMASLAGSAFRLADEVETIRVEHDESGAL